MLKLQINDRLSVLFSPYSGALVLIINNWYDKLDKNGKNIWLKKHLLLLDKNDEEAFLKKQKQAIDEKCRDRGLFVYVSPSYRCPMSCVYCFQKNVKNTSTMLSENLISNILENVGKYNINNYKVTIALFGGEPLLDDHFDFNKKLIQESTDKDYMIKIVTSGTTISEKYFLLLEKYAKYIEEIDIGIDGTPKIHNKLRPMSGKNSFELIRNNVDRLLKMSLNISAKTNIGKDNINDIINLVNLYEKYGWLADTNFKVLFNFVSNFSQIDDNGQTISKLNIFDIYKQLKPYLSSSSIKIDSLKEMDYLACAFIDSEMFCGLPRINYCAPDNRLTLSISPNGEFYPCNWSTGNKNLQIKSFGQKYNIINTNNLCKNCEYYSLCGGGCLIDRQRDDYFDDCKEKRMKQYKAFIREAIKNNNIKIDPFFVVKKEFGN